MKQVDQRWPGLPLWRPDWPLDEDMQQHLHAGMLVAEGPLALCPCLLREHWLSHAPAGPCSTAPSPLGGPVHPQNPATMAL